MVASGVVHMRRTEKRRTDRARLRPGARQIGAIPASPGLARRLRRRPPPFRGLGAEGPERRVDRAQPKRRPPRSAARARLSHRMPARSASHGASIGLACGRSWTIPIVGIHIDISESSPPGHTQHSPQRFLAQLAAESPAQSPPPPSPPPATQLPRRTVSVGPSSALCIERAPPRCGCNILAASPGPRRIHIL